MSKTRSDNILLNLPEEQQAQLAEWLLSGVPYHRAKELLEKEFAVSFRSLSCFSKFWEVVCVPVQKARWNRAAKNTDSFAEAVAANPGRFDAATIAALKLKAYELASSPGADPEAVKAVFSLVLKARDQDLANERLRLDWDKFQKDFTKAAMEFVDSIKSIKGDSSLDNDQKIAAVRKVLFGVEPGPQKETKGTGSS